MESVVIGGVFSHVWTTLTTLDGASLTTVVLHPAFLAAAVVSSPASGTDSWSN